VDTNKYDWLVMLLNIFSHLYYPFFRYFLIHTHTHTHTQTQIQIQIQIHRGGEDDELQLRCNALGIKWDFPRLPSSTSNSKPPITDLEDMTLQEKLKFLKSHREWKCMVKWEALEEHDKTWKTNGLVDLNYKVLKTTPLDNKDIKKAKATRITVDVKLNSNNHWANDKCGVDFQG
jgi:hypothetical protein